MIPGMIVSCRGTSVVLIIFNHSPDCSGDNTSYVVPQNTCSLSLGATASQFSCHQTTCMNLDVYPGRTGCAASAKAVQALVPNQCTGPAFGTRQYIYEACVDTNNAWQMRLGCNQECSDCTSTTAQIPIGECYLDPYATKAFNASYVLQACTPCLASDMTVWIKSTCAGPILVKETLASGACYPGINPGSSYSVTCPS